MGSCDELAEIMDRHGDDQRAGYREGGGTSATVDRPRGRRSLSQETGYAKRTKTVYHRKKRGGKGDPGCWG